MKSSPLRLALALLAAAAVAAGLFVYTTGKLQQMRMVRGEIPGGRFVEGKIARKWESPGKHGPVYWLQITYVADGSRKSHRDNVEEEAWTPLEPGDPIRLAILPNGSAELPGGIWASDGNMIFDRVLQAVELLGTVLLGAAAGACACLGARRRPQAERQVGTFMR